MVVAEQENTCLHSSHLSDIEDGDSWPSLLCMQVPSGTVNKEII